MGHMLRDQEYEEYIQRHAFRTRGSALRVQQSMITSSGDTETVGLGYTDRNRNKADCGGGSGGGGGGSGGSTPNRNSKSPSKNKRIPIPKRILETNVVNTGFMHPYGCIILPTLFFVFCAYILYCLIDFVWFMGFISGWISSITGGLVGIGCGNGKPGGCLTENEVNKLVCDMISKYDADKTGQPDLALESGGGQIVSTRDTKYSKTKDSGVTFMGVPIYNEPNEARNIIKPEVAPGTCWEFEGTGNIVIKLISPAIITGFSVEHLPRDNSPNGRINSAPKNINVLGLKDPKNLNTAHSFGEYEYDENGGALQYFQPLSSSEEAFPFVEFKIMSNHGAEKTCLYRVRVHGRNKRDGIEPFCSGNLKKAIEPVELEPPVKSTPPRIPPEPKMITESTSPPVSPPSKPPLAPAAVSSSSPPSTVTKSDIPSQPESDC